jgi:probable rRNA maturation factor
MPSRETLHVDVVIDADAPVPSGVTEEALAALARYVLSEEGVSGTWEIGVRFVDDPTMQVAHRDFMGIDTPTDIMTFPYEDDDDFGPMHADTGSDAMSGGDLLISVETAAANAREAGWALEAELRFLVCHGLLHLLGWDDAGEEERAAMLDRQAALMRSFGEAG